MINLISNWAGELIVALVVTTIIEMLLPENKVKKYVKTVIGVYIMFCIISPFINKQEFLNIFENTEKNLLKIQVENSIASSQNETSSIEDLYIQEFQKNVEKQVQDLGYKVNKCDVSIQIDATKENAGINSIYLNIDKQKLNSKQGQDIQIEDVEKVEISINNQEDGENNDNLQETEDTKKVKEFLSHYYEISQDKIKIVQD